MARIVEIVGPSGIGKSYLYNQLRDEWNEKDKWAVYHDFRYERKSRHSFSRPEIIYEYLYNLINRVKYISYKNTGGEQLYHMKKFHEDHMQFVNHTLDIINRCCREFYKKDNRYLATLYFYKSVEELQAILELNHDKRICLFDEGLLSRIMHLSSESLTDQDMDEYLKYMPVPDGIILLKSDSRRIRENIKKRRRVATIHQGLNDQQLQKYTEKTQYHMEYAARYFREKGVKVMEFNLDAVGSNQIGAIVEALNRI